MLTIPNALTLLRGLGVPLFIAVGLGGSHDLIALVILMVGGATDYFDGKLARAWNQTSRFGELADPAIDRLYILAVLFVLERREAIPLWLVLLLVGRDFILGLQLVALKRRGIAPLAVTYMGKAATFNLLYAFPLLLLTLQNGSVGTIASIFGWAFAIWGVGLYLFTGATYFIEGLRQINQGQFRQGRL